MLYTERFCSEEAHKFTDVRAQYRVLPAPSHTTQVEHHNEGSSSNTWSSTAYIILPQIDDVQGRTQHTPNYETGTTDYTKMYRLGGDLNSVVCSRVTSTKGIQYWRTAIVGIYLAFYLRYYTLRYIKKWVSKSELFSSGIPSPCRGSGWITQLTEPCAYNPSTARYGVNGYNI